jgi:hypothetical protein
VFTEGNVDALSSGLLSQLFLFPSVFVTSVISGDKMAAILRRKTSSGSGVDVMLWFVMLPLLVMATR